MESILYGRCELALGPYEQIHVFSATYDNLRYLSLSDMDTTKYPFKIIPGHHGGTLSDIGKLVGLRTIQIHTCISTYTYCIAISEDGQYMVSISGMRGWEGKDSRQCFFYYIKRL